jgi:hypothetical protein
MPTSPVPAPIASATVDRLSLTAEPVRGTAPDAMAANTGCYLCCSPLEAEASQVGVYLAACFEAE